MKLAGQQELNDGGCWDFGASFDCCGPGADGVLPVVLRLQGFLKMVVSQNRGTPFFFRPQNTIVLIGTPKMVPLILGNPQIEGSRDPYEPLFRGH